jgi:hypothetical protein
MATRPWITPAEVKDYTTYDKVSARTDAKMLHDITRAESYLIDRFGNDFSDAAKFPSIPPDVKLAAILVTEVYSYNAMLDPEKSNVKSETFDDYTYTRSGDGSLSVDVLDLEPLMHNYAIQKPEGKTFMRMTAI